MNAIYLTHAAELWSADPANPGPTGRFVEVLEGEVQDAGGNVLFRGPADECVRNYQAGVKRGKFVLVPTDWQEAAGEVAGATFTWRLVTG